jgi:hypothetical protein
MPSLVIGVFKISRKHAVEERGIPSLSHACRSEHSQLTELDTADKVDVCSTTTVNVLIHIRSSNSHLSTAECQRLFARFCTAVGRAPAVLGYKFQCLPALQDFKVLSPSTPEMVRKLMNCCMCVAPLRFFCVS